MSYRLTTNEMTLVDTIASQFAEWSTTYRNWCPIRKAPPAPYTKYYRYTDPHAAAYSKDGKNRAKLAMAKIELEANMTFLTYDISIDYLEMEAARRNGIPYLQDMLTAGLRNLDNQIGSLLFNGTSAEKHSVAITGLLGHATEVAAQGSVWDTAPNPLAHIKLGITRLESQGHKGPFTWILSQNLKAGLNTLHNAASDLSHGSVIKMNYPVSNTYFEMYGDNTDQTYTPFPAATADDGVWLLVDAKPENFRLVEAIAPTVKMQPVMDEVSMSWKGKIQWLGTVQAPQTGALAKETSVNLA